jgi:hypothetical protein
MRTTSTIAIRPTELIERTSQHVTPISHPLLHHTILYTSPPILPLRSQCLQHHFEVFRTSQGLRFNRNSDRTRYRIANDFEHASPAESQPYPTSHSTIALFYTFSTVQANCEHLPLCSIHLCTRFTPIYNPLMAIVRIWSYLLFPIWV